MKNDWIPPSREKILETLRAADVPLSQDELADALSVIEPPHRTILDRRLAAMERDGQLLPNRKGVLLLASKLNFIAGRVIGHRDGFGFVRPDEGGSDLFLSPRQMEKAMHGDRVLVKSAGQDSRGRQEAAIVEVTERAHAVLVGRFLNERGVQIVVPEDKRIKHDILIAPGEAGGATHGQVVTCEITVPPARNHEPIGKVTAVLGDIGDPGMEIEIAVRKFDVPHEFDPATVSQADKLPERIQRGDLTDRIDLRDVPLITIDGADARDFDDAVYCEPVMSAGKRPRQTGFRLLVAIADVSHYVKPGSALDSDAITRSTSVYFPRRVIPMLPEKLSNGLCSLNPAVDRLVMVCDMVVGMKGNIRAYQFYPAVMHSAARTTYDEVWGILSGRGGGEAAERVDAPRLLDDQALEQRLVPLHDLYRVFAAARAQRGALEFDSVETRIECDAAGRIERIVPATRNDAHRLIEECMLAANVCAADFIKKHKHLALFRVHEGPTPEKLKQLKTFLKNVGLSLGGGEDPTPIDYKTLFEQISSRPDSQLLQTMMLRSMQQAVYTADNSGHFGLAYDAYAHFTSPIRRYPDLLIHRVLKALIDGNKYLPKLPGHLLPPHLASAPKTDSGAGKRRSKAEQAGVIRETWDILGTMCSSNERRADEASRDVMAWLKCQYMRDRVGDEYRGRITGVAPFGIFVTLDALYVEGMVHVSELGSDYFQYNDAGHELLGERTGVRYRLTDPIDIQISRVDLESRKIDFRLLGRVTTGAKPRPARTESAARAGKPAKADKTSKTGKTGKVGKTSKSKRQPKASAKRSAATKRSNSPDVKSGKKKKAATARLLSSKSVRRSGRR
ncbi:MAG: ribonuclease R [Burkholderiaceae bacterium]